MLGDRLGEGTGKITGTRILPGEGGRYVKMELSFQHTGKILGVPISDMGTYTAYERIPGQIYGEGQGMLMTEDGDGIIYSGFGVGTPTGQGMAMRWRACVSFQTNSPKLARVNGVLGLLEQEVDAEGNSKIEAWEWK